MVRNGEYSPSAQMTPTKGWRGGDDRLYICRDLAKQESLVYYFNEDWFDFEDIERQNRSTGNSRIRYSNPPNRCKDCNKAWSYSGGKSVDNFYYLDKESFINLPLEKKLCPNCE